MITLIAQWARKDKVVELPIVGRDNAPSLVAFIERYGVKTTDAPPDYEAKVQDSEDAWIDEVAVNGTRIGCAH